RFEAQVAEQNLIEQEVNTAKVELTEEKNVREELLEQAPRKTARLVDIKPEQTQKSVERKRKPVARYAAAAVLLPIAFYSIWLPVQTDVLESGVLSLNDFNPFYKKEKGSYQAKKGSESKLPKSEERNLDQELNN